MQTRNYTNSWTLLLVVLLFTLTSCNKKFSNIFDRETTLVVDDSQFEFLSSKAKINYASKKNSISGTANIRIQKDSIIWISLSPGLGIEAARLLVTNDSLVLIDKINKVFFNYGYDSLSKRLDFRLSYDLIESVIVGNLLYPYSKESLIKNSKTYAYSQQQGTYLFENFIGIESKKLERISVLDTTSSNTVTVDYENFQLVDEEVFPFQINALLSYVGDSNKETTVNIEYKQTQISEKPLKFPFNIPQRYEAK
ncbi:MAG: DUF4292 domain-containing protein [Cyclobacteriaceae bacterium]